MSSLRLFSCCVGAGVHRSLRGVFLAVFALMLIGIHPVLTYAEEPTAAGEPTIAPTIEPPSVNVVVIDPGHGGANTGLVLDHVVEKEYVLALAEDLKETLLKQAYMKVFLTRRKDMPVTITERMTLANIKDADVFISLHLCSRTQRDQGLGVYVNKHINRQVMAEQFQDPIPSSTHIVPWDTAQNDKRPGSIRLGGDILSVWESYAGNQNASKERNRVKEAPLAVLSAVYAPAVLVELPIPEVPSGENGELLAAENRKAVALNLARGIMRFLSGR